MYRFLDSEQYGAKNGALAVVTIANFTQLTAMSNPNPGGRGGAGGGRSGLNGPNYQVKKFAQTPGCAAVPAVTAGIELTNALFAGEREGAQPVFYAAGSNAKIDSFDLNARKKLNLKVEVKAQDGRSENVVGMLEGSDPVLKNEFVIMSAHLDHIGLSAPLPNGHNVNNGADDDGSIPPGAARSGARLRRGRSQESGRNAASFPLERRRRRACWARSTSPSFPGGCQQNRGGSGYRHDRPHAESESVDAIRRTCW